MGKYSDFDRFLLQKNQSLSTRTGNIRSVQNYLTWLESEALAPCDARHSDIMAYVHQLIQQGNQKSTVNRKLLSLRYYYDYLQSQRKITDNPVSEIKLRGIVKRQLHDPLTAEELAALFERYPDHGLAGKRNKSIVGMMVYQALDSGEIARLEVNDVDLKSGKIHIKQHRKTNARSLALKGEQIVPLQIYLTEIRPLILQETGKKSGRLFVSMGSGEQLYNALGHLCKQLRRIHPKVKSPTHIRLSVISLWLETQDIRSVQYRAGHRYVSSTERYRSDQLKGLQEQIGKIHPLG